MDIAHLMTLVAALSGDPDPTAFATVKAGGAVATTPVTVHACTQPIGYEEIEGKTIICGTIAVPEDHDRPEGRKIGLEFAVLKAKSSYPEPDPVVHLHGGPGGGVVDQLPGYASIFEAYRQTRDIVLFDQRSAGLSDTSVACYTAMGANAPSIVGLPGVGDTGDAAMSACFAELIAAGVDLPAYNTLQNAYDVRDIVRTLGYDSYNLYGISYGTKLALEVMRSAPEGLRSVIIDGVAPPQVKLYDTTAVPPDEALDGVVAQCEADPACAAAYPDLRTITVDLLSKAAAGELTIDGADISPSVIVTPVLKRNGQYQSASLTPYIPAYLYELHRAKDTPTIDMLSDAGYVLPRPTIDAVTSAAASLPSDQRKLIGDVVAGFNADIAARTSMQQGVWALTAAAKADAYGPIVQLFDTELTSATTDLLVADASQAITRASGMVADYVGLQAAEPSRPALLAFVDKYFTGDAQDRLRALVEAMRESEIEGSFELIRQSSHQAASGYLLGQHLATYACQEDVPFNSAAGFAEVTPTLHFPGLAAAYDSTIQSLFALCSKLAPQPREGFHEPVVSDIPTLAIGSMWDTQTAASWAGLAATTLVNGQSTVIPEAGHGAILYQRCAVDMGVAFFNAPMRKLDDRCAKSIKTEFYIAPWVATDTPAASKP